MEVGPYCSIRQRGKGWTSLYVGASRSVQGALEGSMLNVGNDRASYQVCCWGDGRALVLAHYSSIIGSHYLAIIDESTIPQPEEATA
jgi:hypothetical protein